MSDNCQIWYKSKNKHMLLTSDMDDLCRLFTLNFQMEGLSDEDIETSVKAIRLTYLPFYEYVAFDEDTCTIHIKHPDYELIFTNELDIRRKG